MNNCIPNKLADLNEMEKFLKRHKLLLKTGPRRNRKFEYPCITIRD